MLFCRCTGKAARAAALAIALGAFAPVVHADVFSNVPNLDGYSVVYTQQIANYSGNAINVGGTPYAQDFSAAYPAGSFSRVGYYLELQSTTVGAPLTYAYAEFDAAGFTNDATKIGVPTNGTTQVFQQNVTNMRVVSNVAGVVNGSNISTGNIEFWPHNYTAPKDATLSPSNASDSLFDFGDTRATALGYGSLQIHNNGAGAAQTILAYNRWGNAGAATTNGTIQQMDLGIGNSTTAQARDWTFVDNSATYSVKNLQVVVNTPRPKPALTLNSGVAANVPASETNGYQLVYKANLPTANAFNAATNYVINNSAQVANGSFGRVSYYLELKDNSNVTKWVWISADAFTASAGKIGVPLASTGAMFQGKLSNVNVVASSNSGITGGSNLGTANIEFWPTNYTQQDQEGIAGSSNTLYDVGDEITAGNFGSMQIHNAGQTLFAFNHWGGATGITDDIGIGNSPTGNPDWTQTNSGANYTSGSATLYVFVSPVPEPSSAVALLAFSGLALSRRRRSRAGV